MNPTQPTRSQDPAVKPMFPSRRRAAFTMIEMVIVLGIIVILAALGVGASQELLPRFRARKAANLFAAAVAEARIQAMMNNRETRLEVTDYDSSPTDVESPGYGAWEVKVGNRINASTCWDILPFENNSCADLYTGEGKTDISKGGTDYMRHVGLEEPDVKVLTFSSRGRLINDASDLTLAADSGYAEYRFYNKVGADKGLSDYYNVRVYRSGMVRVESAMNPEKYENDGGGTAIRSSE